MSPEELATTAVLEPQEFIGMAVPDAVARRIAHRYRSLPRHRGWTEPSARSRPVPVPAGPMVGPRMLIYKQDPSVTELGVRAVFIPSIVLKGPTDAQVTTELTGVTPVGRNIDGDFIFPPNSPEFDCAHTFAVVRQTLTMYERHNGGDPLPFAWNSGGNTEPITVFPRAGSDDNAFYSRTAQALKFFFFMPNESETAVFTCRSLDIVAHETGHAVLDGLRPGWLAAGNPPQTGGLHEAFGDLSAIFLALSQPDQAEALVAATKADLHAKSFLPAVAEEFGAALGMEFGLRNADNDLKLSQVGNEVHAISQVFTGGIYDVLADIYAFERTQHMGMDPTMLLMQVGSKVCKMLFDAIMRSPATGATYADVVNQMLQVSAGQGDPMIYRTFIRNRFTFREVVVSPVPITDLLLGQMDMADAAYTGDGKAKDVTELKPADESMASLRAVQDRSACCGTMQLPEFHVMDVGRLATRGPLTDDDTLAADRERLSRSFTKFSRDFKTR